MVVVVAGKGLFQGEVLLDRLRTQKVDGRESLHRGVGRHVVGIARLQVREHLFRLENNSDRHATQQSIA